MSDELVKQWGEYVESMGSAMGDVEHIAQQMCDRIEQLVATNEQLTAERDKWKTAFDEACDAWQKQCEHEMDRANKAAAERDRLRAALWDILACETINANSTVTRMASITKAALKGETP